MKQEQFIYWLQGYCEVCGERPSEEQWEMIKKHLQSVFSEQIMPSSYPLDIPNGTGTNPLKPPYEIICRNSSENGS